MTDRKCILLIADDPKDIDLILSALNEPNLTSEVVVVGDGTEALDYLHRRGKYRGLPDGYPIVILVLFDLEIRRMDGVEILMRIKFDEPLNRIPIVMLSSSRDPRDIETCYQLGDNAYVVKPIKFVDFIEAVRIIGIFWTLINEPLPRSLKNKQHERNSTNSIG
jgi:CheY-like chemotaxis protein